MAISGGLDASADCSLQASTSTPTLQDCVTDRNSYSDDTPEVNTTLAASWPLTGQVHVEPGNFTAEPTMVLMALSRDSG